MGRSGSGNSSWLDVVKKALRSPTKQTKTLKARMREDKDEAADKKRSNKRRWIFKKTCVHETTTIILHDESMSSETTVATVEVIGLSSPKHNAALVIQTSFRRYLARRALAALKGVVKLQALVRGHNIRTRTKMTLSCMQALLRVQARLCDQRRKLISNQPTFHMGSHLALAHNHSTIWRSSQSEYRYCHEDLEEDRKDQTVQMDTYHISPSLIWERSQNQQQRLINSSSPLHHHNFQSHSPITPSSLSRIKTSVNPRCQREEKNPSYMSATVSAMARQRMPTTTDHGDKKTSARKRLSFGGGVSDSELDYNSTYAMETRLSISSCSKEKIQGEISPPSIGQHRRCFR